MTQMQDETVLYETADGIATITLNRPDKMNAFNAAMGRAIVVAFRHAEQDEAVRVIIFTGAGRAFCAGPDIGGFAGDIAARETGAKRSNPADDGNGMLAFPHLVRTMSKPSIAALNGYALGVGITMVLPCDIRIMAEEAKAGFIFARVGLMAELGSTYFLPRLIGSSRAAEMMLTGRQYSAAECLELGLVSAVAPAAALMDKARAMASEIAQGSGLSVAMLRRALFQGLDGTLDHAMEFENFALERCARSTEHREYVSAFMAQRAPERRKAQG